MSKALRIKDEIKSRKTEISTCYQTDTGEKKGDIIII